VIHRDAAVRTAVGQSGAGSRPCSHCGRPVPQPYAATQLFRYCRDNDGACQRAARRVGLHRGAGPGLGDHVARAVVVTERLEHVVDALNEALHSNLSPAGVERQIAAVRGEAAASVAAAHAQRDEARQEAHQARDEAEAARREAEQARREAEQARQEADQARTEADAARASVEAAAAHTQQVTEQLTTHGSLLETVTAERDAARRELAEVTVARDHAVHERNEVYAVAGAAEAERERAVEALTELARVRTENLRLSAELSRFTAAVTSLREEVARGQQKSAEQENLRVGAERRADALAVRLRAAEAERDAARAELDSARFQAARIDEQVSNLASALARLGTAAKTDVPMPAAWAVRDQKSA
jgi:chromosome segregation ATPase